MDNQTPDLRGMLGGGAALLAVLGGSAVTGALSRVSRDERPLLLAASVLAFVSVIVWGLRFAVLRSRRSRVSYVAVAGLTIAALMVAIAVEASTGIQGVPSIDVNVVGGANPVLRTAIHEGGLGTGSTLHVQVTAYAGTAPIKSLGHGQTPGTPIYVGAIGPNATGDADLNLSLPVDPRKFSAVVVAAAIHSTPRCGFFRKKPVRTGCVVVALRPRARTP